MIAYIIHFGGLFEVEPGRVRNTRARRVDHPSALSFAWQNYSNTDCIIQNINDIVVLIMNCALDRAVNMLLGVSCRGGFLGADSRVAAELDNPKPM